jgi:hypothetical protein
VSLRSAIVVWIGLMGLAATAVSMVLLRLFPRAFSESDRAFAWPWQAPASRSARSRGWLVLAAALLSVGVVIIGVVSFLT